MSNRFQKFSGVCGILAGVAGLLYLVFFIVYKNPAALLPALALLAVGLFASATLVGLYQAVRKADEGFALFGLLLGFAGAIGAAAHAAFDLANALHPPATPFAYANPVDPRGFLTFAAAGVAAMVLSWLILQSNALPRTVGYLGIVAGILLILLYIVYLLTLDALNPVVLALIVVTGLLQPVWYLWIGWVLQKERTIPSHVASARHR
jgi:hypothetical protein